MADQNNLDIRTRLTNEDYLSPGIVRALGKVKSLEAQIQKFGKTARQQITSIPMEDYVKQINTAGKSLNGLTKKHYDWAKSAGVASDKAEASWTQLTNKIRNLAAEHRRWVNSHDVGSKKMAAQTERMLRTEYKNAQAFKYIYNNLADQRLDMHRRLTQQLTEVEAQHLRNQQRSHNQHLTGLQRMHRDAMRSMNQLSGIGNRAIPYTAAAAAASGYAGVSAFKIRMRVDTAETNLRMFGGLSDAEVRQMRKGYGNAAGIKYGLTPDKLIDSYTEVIKAGIPKDKAQAVTDAILKAGSGLDIDIKETTRFATRLATLTQDMKHLDPDKLKSMLNAVAISANESAADSNEIIAANRRASGVFATSKFTPEDLSAFTGTGVGIGLPSAKVGTFMGFLVNELVGAKNTRGQRAKDMSKAANLLGLGGRNQMSAQMAANPADTLMRIFDKIGGMNEQQQNKVLTLIGMREWRDELAAFVEARGNLADLLKQVRDPKNANKIDEISDKKLKSLAGRWKSFVSAMTLVWESVGAGLEKAFGQITDFFTQYFGKFDTAKITETVEAFTDGIVAGMGYSSWADMLKAAFGDPGSVKSWSQQVFDFTKGFVAEIKNMFTIIANIVTGIAKQFGASDAEAAGKFTAQIIELAVALKAIGTVAGYLEGIVTFVKGIGGLLLRITGIPGILSLLGVGAAASSNLGVPEHEIRRPGEKWQHFQGRRESGRTLQRYNPSGADPMFVPTSYTGSSDFSGRRRSTGQDLADNLNKFTGKVERAAFINSGPGGGVTTAFYSGGGGGGGIMSSGGGARSFIGGVPSLLTNKPGTALPGSILGNSGIIRRGGGGGIFSNSTLDAKDRAWFGGGGAGITSPSIINGATPGGGPDGVGAGLSGNAFLQARRARFAEEIKSDPSLALHLAAMQQTEGASRGGTIESLMNRADMQGKSLRQMLGFSADGVRSTDSRGRQNSFYGPIRRGEIYGAIRRMQSNPAEFAKYNALTQKALAGSHVIGGYTDQGLPTDPNGSRRTGIPGFKISPKDGNEFTDWVGPGSTYGRGRQGAINYRRFIEQGIAGSGDSPIGNVPTPAEAIQNVPAPIRGDASMGLQRGGGGPVAIHINGNSHDPEALATLVQRRIDESMNWRTNDTSSEYS